MTVVRVMAVVAVVAVVAVMTVVAMVAMVAVVAVVFVVAVVTVVAVMAVTGLSVADTILLRIGAIVAPMLSSLNNLACTGLRARPTRLGAGAERPPRSNLAVNRTRLRAASASAGLGQTGA